LHFFAYFGRNVAAVTRSERAAITLVPLVLVFVLANVNIEVDGGCNEIDVVLNRNGNGVRVASNVMRASGAVLINFVDGLDCCAEW
jgi:hypothetical protein